MLELADTCYHFRTAKPPVKAKAKANHHYYGYALGLGVAAVGLALFGGVSKFLFIKHEYVYMYTG